MALALIAEGIMSAAYHFCPSRNHYQFGEEPIIGLVKYLDGLPVALYFANEKNKERGDAYCLTYMLLEEVI